MSAFSARKITLIEGRIALRVGPGGEGVAGMLVAILGQNLAGTPAPRVVMPRPGPVTGSTLTSASLGLKIGIDGGAR
jgi:hypothetical protein